MIISKTVRECVRACVCVHTCVRVFMHAYVRSCVHVCKGTVVKCVCMVIGVYVCFCLLI